MLFIPLFSLYIVVVYLPSTVDMLTHEVCHLFSNDNNRDVERGQTASRGHKFEAKAKIFRPRPITDAGYQIYIMCRSDSIILIIKRYIL